MTKIGKKLFNLFLFLAYEEVGLNVLIQIWAY